MLDTNGNDLKSGVPLVRALERGLTVLRCFTIAAPRLTLSDVARIAELDVGTTRRLLQTLMVTGFVGYDDVTSRYFLTGRVLEIGAAAQTGRDLRDVARGSLRELAERTGATAFIWVCTDGMALCIDRVRTPIPSFDAAWFSIGSQTTLNAGGGPRVLLAFIDAAERRNALRREMIRRTPASIMDPTVLAKRVILIRERGWELAVDDFVLGLAGLAVPIWTPNKTLAGALSISGLTSSFGDHENPLHLNAMRDAAAVIGSQLSDMR